MLVIEHDDEEWMEQEEECDQFRGEVHRFSGCPWSYRCIRKVGELVKCDDYQCDKVAIHSLCKEEQADVVIGQVDEDPDAFSYRGSHV